MTGSETVLQETRAQRSPLRHMAQLDGLRALAVTAVVIHHYTGNGWRYGADSGVKLFFTLSGFLITGILLRGRDDAAENNLNRIGVLGRFYARRFLRIFPLYYLVVGVAFAIDLEPARRLIGSLLTYTFNIHMARQGYYEDNFAHFWTLSVEEQFYICWAWLVLFLPRKLLVPGMLALVASGPLYRLSYILSGYQNMTPLSTYISTLSCVDNLGLGALLAIFTHCDRINASAERRMSRIVLPASILLTATVAWWASDNVKLVSHDLVQAVAFCCVISAASRGIGGPVGQFLEWKPMLYLGKISYGVYVYHPLMPVLSRFLLMKTVGLTLADKTLPVSGLALLLTIVIASLSWHLFERPINDLKRYF